MLAAVDLPGGVIGFLSHSLELALHGQTHEVAASFCHGRENLLPDVFSAFKGGVGGALAQAPTFQHYLNRHIELDHDEHGPLALRLLASLTGDDPERVVAAERAGIVAIEARLGLWDGILETLGEP